MQMQVQKIPHRFPLVFAPSTSCLPPAGGRSPGGIDWGIGLPPDAAARIAAIRCFALSSPWSAAFTYHTLASRGSLRQPMPISVKYPRAYSAFGRPRKTWLGDARQRTTKEKFTKFSSFSSPFASLVLVLFENGLSTHHVPSTQCHHCHRVASCGSASIEMNT